MYSVISEDLKIQAQVAAKSGPCLLDCMELVLADVDVFSAKKNGIRPGASNKDGWIYQIERDVSTHTHTLHTQTHKHTNTHITSHLQYIACTIVCVHMHYTSMAAEALYGLLVGSACEFFIKIN